MSAEGNKALVRRLYAEVWNTGNLDLADELCTADVVHHGPGDPTSDGLGAYKEYITACRTIFPDLRFDIEEPICEGDQVAVRWVLHGTHRGTVALLDLAPTGKNVELQGATIYQVSDGKLADAWTIRETVTSKVAD